MKVETLNSLDEKELRELIAHAQMRLQNLETERREKAIAQIRELAVASGLKVQIGGEKKNRTGSTADKSKPSHKAGLRFTHPEDSSKTYTVGRGRKPKWVQELEEKGVKPE